MPLNKVCRVADAANPVWRQGYRDQAEFAVVGTVPLVSHAPMRTTWLRGGPLNQAQTDAT